MGKIKLSGPLKMKLASFLAINKVAIATYARHAFEKRMEPSWAADIEIGIRFWRQQFTKTLTHPDIATGRLIFDSLQTETDDDYPVTSESCDTLKGTWHRPDTQSGDATILYLHGGGYALHGAISVRFANMLAHRTRRPLFAPDYRLTPEHPHPAQADDALAAWDYVTTITPANRIIVIGDSAGGHMALMLLQTLKKLGRDQPALCIGLCPWTDIGDRGQSLHENDTFDMVQGWMALQFGEWLDPKGSFGREMLSPISYDYAGLAPLYLQAGGREILRDMILDFAETQTQNGADILLDIWDDMPHDFQVYDSLKSSSTQALSRIKLAIDAHVGDGRELRPIHGLSASYGGTFRAE
jgi:acetyl esterase/lipase